MNKSELPYRDPSPMADAGSLARGRRRRFARALALVAATSTALWVSLRDRPAPTMDAVPPALRGATRLLVLGDDPLPPATPLAPLLVSDQPERIAVIEPVAGATRIARGAAVVVRFNRPMVAAGALGRALPESPLRFDPPVVGVARWTSRSTLAFQADESTWASTRECSLHLVEGLRALSGEVLSDATERVVVFDGSPRLVDPTDTRRVAAGEPLRLTFDGRVDANALRAQLLAYELGGAMRPMTFTTRSAGRDGSGRSLVDVVLGRSLEPGAQVALAFAPVLRPYDTEGSQPGVVQFEFMPRPQIEGVDCAADAASADGCSYGPRPGRVVDVRERLTLLATTSLDPASAGAVTVSPALAGMRVEVRGRALTLQGDWAADQVYEVRFGPMRSEEGVALLGAAPLAVRSAGLAPAVTVATGRLTWEREGAADLPFATVNAARGTVQVAALDDAALVSALLSRTLPAAGRTAWQGASLPSLAPMSRANRWGRGTLAWRAVSGGDAALVRFDPDGDGESPAREAIAQRSDIGLSVTSLPEGVLVWATSLSRARPLSGARIRVFDELGAVVGHATTGDDGAAWIPLTSQLLAGRLVALANHGDDRVGMLVDPRIAAGPGAFGVAQGEARRDALAPVAAVILDRGAYRPGERVRAKVIARVAERGALCAYGRQTVRVVLRGPAGEVAGQSVRLSRAGSGDAEFTLEDRAVTGSYEVVVVRGESEPLGRAGLEVAEFRQPTARVDLALDRRDLTDGDRLGASVRARYLFGAPLANGAARWSLRRVGGDEMPTRWRDFVFGPIDVAPRAGTVDEGDGVVDAEGALSIETHVRQGVPIRERNVLEVVVRDAAGQETSARETFTVFPAAYEVGLRRLDAWIDHGRAIDVDALVIGHDGNPVERVAVDARIYREAWHGYYEWAQGDGGAVDGAWQARRDRQREEVHRCAVVSGPGPVRCAWQPTAPGTYLVEATVTDAAGRRSVSAQRLYVAGPTERPDRDPPGAPISLTPVRAAWFVGERARLSLECPWPEAEVLVAVVREGVLHQERRRVQAGSVVIELPVTPAMIPNAFVAVTLVRPRTGAVRAPGALDLDAPDVRWGVTELSVRPQEDPLQVELRTANERAPGGDVPIELTVRDSGGRGVSTEVLLYAVDEGVLRLTRYEAPDPAQALLPRRAPRFAIEDLRRTVVSRISLPALPNASGDGEMVDATGEGESLRDARERFDPTPLWLPRLRTDATGTARAVLHLPDRAGQYRVMAIAVGEGLRSGRAEALLHARRDVAVRATLPRALTEGDRFEAGALLNNTADHAVDATVVCTVDGREVSRRAVRLGPGAEQRVAEMIEARGPRMDVAFVVEAGGDRPRDGRVIPVGPRGFTGRASRFGAVDGRAELTLTRPVGSEAAEATLTLSTRPFLGLDAAAEDLDAETWGATESIASRVLGWSALARAGDRRPGVWSPRQVRARGESALETLRAQRNESGGFGTWGPQSYTDPYLTAYALRALAAARRAGWSIEDDLIAGASSVVRQWVLGRSVGAAGADELAFALRALHDVGADQGGVVTQLFEQRDALGPYGCAQLAMAMMPGDPRRDTLLVAAGRMVGAASVPSIARATFFDSRPRTLSAVLEAAVRTDRFSLARDVAGQLLAARAAGAGWGGAHATAHAIDALSLFAGRFEEERSLQARVWLDGTELQPAARGDATARYHFDASRLTAGDHRVRIEGSGPLFTALDGRWRTPIGDAEQVARGRSLALHRVLETEAGWRLGEGDSVRVGELVRVRLWAYAEGRTAPYVVVRNVNGGGFEAVDEGLDTSPQGSIEALLGMSADDAALDPRVYHALRSVSDITARRLFGGATVFHLDQGVQGLREYTYGVRATTPGRFLIPPAEARALYDDDTVARSAVQTLVVTR